tara:strand:- start:148 stop:480 length:333 start_codon:yes stop_codon:yes gene_type:complete
MNIFNNCQPNNYASDYIKKKRERSQKKDIKIVSSKKKTRKINNQLPFDLNTNIKSSIDLSKNNITISSDIGDQKYIDPSNNLFNTICENKYLRYVDVKQNCPVDFEPDCF